MNPDINPDTVVQLLQKGLRVTLGATTTLIETLQDSQRREENLSRLTSELSQLTEEWEAKGELTEREARNMVEALLGQQRATSPRSAEAPPFSTPESTDSPSSSAPTLEVQQDLQELTAQIAAMRAELERLRQQDNP